MRILFCAVFILIYEDFLRAFHNQLDDKNQQALPFSKQNDLDKVAPNYTDDKASTLLFHSIKFY